MKYKLWLALDVNYDIIKNINQNNGMGGKLFFIPSKYAFLIQDIEDSPLNDGNRSCIESSSNIRIESQDRLNNYSYSLNDKNSNFEFESY